MWKGLVTALLLCVCSASFAQVNLEGFAVSRIQQMKLVDAEDRQIQLAPQLFKPLNIFVFLSPECPLCKNYSTVLTRITGDFSIDSVSMFGVISGKAYSVTDLNNFAKEFAVRFPLFIDPEKKLTNYLRATITPEVVVLDQKGKLVYRGAIDDWVTELGKNKLQPEKHYLRLALTEYIHHKQVSIKRTRPRGCYINEY
jgi:hypothetical protein